MKTEIEQNIQSERETVCRRKLEKRPELLRRIIQAKSNQANIKIIKLAMASRRESLYIVKMKVTAVSMGLRWKGVKA